MTLITHREYLKKLIPVVRRAGESIMGFYSKNIKIKDKEDGSPVTEADKESEKIIIEELRVLAPKIPIVSEENNLSHLIKPSKKYFLVDPLDGTKEFIKSDGKGSFTVNIALIEEGSPTLGIVYAPALDRLFHGSKFFGSFENGKPIKVRDIPLSGAVAVASVSNFNSETKSWLRQNQINNFISIGSSLKFCLVACGEADIYPRFGTTMEWDTAAGQAVLQFSGGTVVDVTGRNLMYGKPNYKNEFFLAKGKI